MLEILITFFSLGLFTFGGGYAMIPLLKETIVNKKHWMTDDEVLEMIAIAESTPGPIAINMATYVGYKRKGFFGSVFATLGVVLPSLIIIYLISLFFDAFMSNQIIQYAFTGIKCGVAILITKTGIDMLIKCKKNIVNIVLFAITLVTMIIIDLFAISFSAIILLLMGGITGIVVYTLYRKILSNKEVADLVMEDSGESVIDSNTDNNTTVNDKDLGLASQDDTTLVVETKDTITTNVKAKSRTTTLTKSKNTKAKNTTTRKSGSTSKKQTSTKKTSTKSKKQEEVK